jgi:hypothetical protein
MSTTTTVETFTTADFEAALREPFPSARCLGLLRGEYVWFIPVVPDDSIGVLIRSSIREDAASATAGADSIRAWIGRIPDGIPWAPKADVRWTTRRPGWPSRLRDVIEELLALAARIRPCPACGAWMKLGRRNDRLQLSCDARGECQLRFDEKGCPIGIPGTRCGTTMAVGS